ncbi:methyltransferase domain-containing protein [Intestinirhabdus alba]|jgi:SAM-dependent methyltransferase|uniref:Methyltransferase domain-containing protein n=1 Tax=Intestinirhabdus alba TaxID=2899544 RepID=A0A6L6IJ33_9ENTR|nr:class I SAM-dependent methyltransferase [Intestinirhabdus alba]MTH46135.1 methyltransferase domain-containing protein [Intestinirhabdus alba]
MGNVVRFPINVLVSDYGVTHFIETGYGKGVSCKAAVAYGFTKALSCEIYPALHQKALQNDKISVALSDSIDFLNSAEITSTLAEKRCLIFLDAHYPGADFHYEDYKSSKWDKEIKLPLLEELALLQGRCDNSVVIIDDCRIYLDELEVYDGPMGEIAENDFANKQKFIELLQGFNATHDVYLLPHDTGYAVLWPKRWGDNVLVPYILPGDPTAKFKLSAGVTGTTSMSINRRLQDARFTSRWLTGYGLDIGGGNDSIGIYQSLFPLIKAVTLYDLPQGDAQYLYNVPDNAFDFVYSAHCLEHMVDPEVALNSWFRVLKKNGYMILTIPDEDMYEQGVWPSTFNYDHKHTFTIFKRESWSPVSINVLELLRKIDGAFEIQKIELLNQSYLTNVSRVDQTRTPYAESGIEIVIKKVG